MDERQRQIRELADLKRINKIKIASLAQAINFVTGLTRKEREIISKNMDMIDYITFLTKEFKKILTSDI